MIVSLTLNPAVNETVFVERLEIGDINRFEEPTLDPDGKGVNVSRVSHRLGWPTIAFGFSAGQIGKILESDLDSEGVQYHFVRVDGQTRLNFSILDKSTDQSTNFYGPGPIVSVEHIKVLDDLLEFWLQAATVLVLAGNLPPGMSDDSYARYIRLAKAKGVKTILDSDGEPFRRGVEAGPYLVKPNVAEAERLLGRRLADSEAVIGAAREISSMGVEVVVISMAEKGAICVADGKTLLARPPKVERRSTVGPGDSLVGGLAVAIARGDGIIEGLKLGTAAGAATAMTRGTALGTAAQVNSLIDRVQIEEVKVRVG